MADDVHYSSAGGESNKRKYEDHQTSTSPAPRRATGFSSGPDSSAPPTSYNSVPPPMSEIELAKQKAQEIAARLLNNVDPMKRARVENGAGGGGFDSTDAGFVQKPMGMGLSGPPTGASYGYPGPSKKIEIPNGRVGVIIGKGGETIKYLQLQSGAKIQVTRDMDADPNSISRGVELMGTPDQVAKAEQLINDVLSEAEAGGSGVVSRRMTGQQSGTDPYVFMVPNNKVGLVIGKGGETIKNMQARTGARIQVIPLHLPPGDTSKERTVQIDGTSEQIEAAKQLVNEVISENRPRNSSMAGGYQHQGYQARPPTNWAPPGPPMQQSGYGYAQSGSYPGPSAQYGMNQPPYSGYPPQPSSGAYASGWDQTTAPPNQQAAQGGGYDYYNQQPPPLQHQAQGGPGTPTDGSGYGYNQASAYSQGQGYTQDSYSGYNAGAGYGQPQPNPVGAGYEQQQQGYNSAYGNVSNPTPDGHPSSYTQGDTNQAPAAGQPYNAGGQPSPNPNYPPQASNQAGYGGPPSSQGSYGTQPPSGYGTYGAPPGQKPPSSQQAYAQPQQSPSGQGGGYTQPGYPQTGYMQSDAGAQKPSAGYPPSQPGYGPPSYGAPPSVQPGYGQQAPYNSSYGSGYSQAPAHSADGSTGAYSRGTYDTTPPPSTAQTGGAAKASPPSG
ncbi:uncharacterized protein LOC142526454 [Primulina tabacum]|uniref:uncharacterized protein LOC142526454 n=1 Tax=Primulina tabacum TaxID=48773 RepID=UPI003F5A9F3D